MKQAKSIVGQRVQVWFDDEGQYSGGLVTKYNENSRQYTVQWDTGECTEIELDWKDKTLDLSNDSRWCLESELDDFERSDNTNANTNKVSSTWDRNNNRSQSDITDGNVNTNDTPQHIEKKQKLESGVHVIGSTSNTQPEGGLIKKPEVIEILDE